MQLKKRSYIDKILRQQSNSMQEMNIGEKFQCNECLRQAVNPVITQCGHLYCWECIYPIISVNKQCPLCKKNASCENCLPIFTDTQNSQIAASGIPPRPNGQRKQKLANPNSIGGGFQQFNINLPNNIANQRQFAGYVFIPSLSISSFNNIQTPINDSPDSLIFKKLRVLFFMGSLLFCLFLIKQLNQNTS